MTPMNFSANELRASYSFWVHEQGADPDSGYGYWESAKIDSLLAITREQAQAIADSWNKGGLCGKTWVMTEVEPTIKV